MRRRHGFTIIELLVVVISAMVLMAIVLATYSRVRQFARITECESNLHQLALAANEYAVHNHGAMPSDYRIPNGYWYTELQPYDTNMAANSICPDATESSAGVGAATLAWGPIGTDDQPYSKAFPWLQNVSASYGLNNYVNPAGQISALAAYGGIALSGNQTYYGDITSATNITGSGRTTVQGNLESGGGIVLSGDTNVSGSQTPDIPGLQPPNVQAIFNQIVSQDNPQQAGGSQDNGNQENGDDGGDGGDGHGDGRGDGGDGGVSAGHGQVIDFTQNPYQLINGNFTNSGQMQIIGSGTLLVTGNVDLSGWFPANGSGAAKINIVCLGNVNISGQCNLNGGIYTAGNFSISGRYNLTGVLVVDGQYSNSGKGTMVQGRTPSFDPRAQGSHLLANQPLLADCIWVDGSPQSTDAVPSNLQQGNASLNADDDMGLFCVDRHMGQINVAFVDGSARTVPLAKLWQLRWSENFQPRNVSMPDSW